MAWTISSRSEGRTTAIHPKALPWNRGHRRNTDLWEPTQRDEAVPTTTSTGHGGKSLMGLAALKPYVFSEKNYTPYSCAVPTSVT